MRYPLLHVTSESKMNSNNQDIIYIYIYIYIYILDYFKTRIRKFCFFPPGNSSLHMANKRRSTVSHGKHTQFLCLFSSKHQFVQPNSKRVWRQYTAFITLLNVPLFSETGLRLLREGQKRRVDYKSSTLKNETIRPLETSRRFAISIWCHVHKFKINIKFFA